MQLSAIKKNASTEPIKRVTCAIAKNKTILYRSCSTVGETPTRPRRNIVEYSAEANNQITVIPYSSPTLSCKTFGDIGF
jgi:hypothetical protein